MPISSAPAPAVFLDKDGTLVENVPYNVDPRLMRLTRRAAAGLRRLAEAGYRLVVVTNQSGVGRGLFAETALSAVQRRLDELILECGAVMAGFYYCPHHPEAVVEAYRGECECRKPSPGMLLRAARELHLDLERSWLVGDILDDISAGRRALCRTVLLDNGHETEWNLSAERRPDFYACDLAEAANCILAAEGLRTSLEAVR